MFAFVYSSYHLKLSFPHLAVILTTLETPNIKTAAKQVWLYFIHRTMQPGYLGITTNLQIVLNAPPPPPKKKPYLNHATQKITCQIFLPQKILESKISNPKKSFDHPSPQTKPWFAITSRDAQLTEASFPIQ